MRNTTDTRSNDDHHNEAKNPEQLEREVDQARARLGRTASELSDRLSPSELLDQAMDMAREHGGEFGRNLGTQVKNNPVPMILTSIGLAWMMMSSGKSSSARAYDPYTTRTSMENSGLMDSLGDAATRSRDKVASVGDRMHDTTATIRESAHSAQHTLVQFYRDQPLLAGSLGIAIGAALGALAPSTEIEDNMFGEARDSSVESAKSKVVEEYDEIRDMGMAQLGPEANQGQ